MASFLFKDLRIDWQSGERYFMQHLLDADLAANNGNWQWCAGTGTDAMRGYRVFNPALQSKKFDPDGTFIRRFAPELERVPMDFIHEPWKMPFVLQKDIDCIIGKDYPVPIVDHSITRKRVLHAYKLRGE